MAVNKKNRFRKFRFGLVLKLTLGVSASTALVYFVVFRYINHDFEKVAIKESKDLAKTVAYDYGCEVQTEINSVFFEMRVLSHVFSTYPNIPKSEAKAFFKSSLKKSASENPKYASVWDSWEYRFLNKNYTKKFGRIITSFFREGDQIQYAGDSINFEGDDTASMYYNIKITNKEFITEPYFYKLGDNLVLMASIGVPLNINNEFAGIVGVDIALENFVGMIDSIKPFDGSEAFLVSDRSTIIAHPDKSLLGKSYLESDSLDIDINEIIQNFTNGKAYDFEYFSNRTNAFTYTVFMPLEIGNSGTTWALAINMPLKTIIGKVDAHMAYTKQIAFHGFILLILIIIIISMMIVLPLRKTTKILYQLSLGDIQNVNQLNIKTGDEIQLMSESVNQVISGLKNTLAFAEKIKDGDYEHQFEPLSEEDILGNSILNMRDSLIKAQKDEEKRQKEDFHKNWSTQGLNMFAVSLRQYNDDLYKLGQEVITKLVDYIDVQSGALYLVENSEYDTYLKLYASSGFPKDRINQDKIYENQGAVGRCLIEKQTIYIDDVPSDFSKITSGLGQTSPGSVLITPLIVNEELIGAIELLGLKPIEEYKIRFVETVSVSIASIISIVRINVRTAELLNESRTQADELTQQEEEMRQNIEELAATQEESSEREKRYLKLIDSVTSAICYVEYDMDGVVIDINDRLLQLFQMKREQAIGKKIGQHEFISKEKRESRIAFWSRLEKGEEVKQEFYAKYLGREIWLQEIYIPILDGNGTPYKVINIAVDISEEKRKEAQLAVLREKHELVKATRKKVEKKSKKNIEELLKDSSKFKHIRLDHLFKVYKGDSDKIINILRIYKEAIPIQIDEIKELLSSREWSLLKAKIVAFRTKMTYLGVKDMNSLSRQLERQVSLQSIDDTTNKIVEEITNIWEEVEKELIQIESF
ncbi:MAG: GAF domain-containing protein [Salinivirgaceae bacterium]|jgi:methyl-accepting chemotaxis protein|nr:GAF domain-containing protein [Bacteroidales bacterium]